MRCGLEASILLSVLALLTNAATLLSETGSISTVTTQGTAALNADTELLRRAAPATSSVTAHYVYKCGNEETKIQEFRLDVSWIKDHMHWVAKGGIDEFIEPGTSESYEGHVGFRHGGCTLHEGKTRCNQLFLGEFRATYNPMRHVVDVSARREARSGGTAVIVLKACKSVISGLPPSCPDLGGEQTVCKLYNVHTT